MPFNVRSIELENNKIFWQRLPEANRILVDLISKIWNTKNRKTEKLTVRLD